MNAIKSPNTTITPAKRTSIKTRPSTSGFSTMVLIATIITQLPANTEAAITIPADIAIHALSVIPPSTTSSCADAIPIPVEDKNQQSVNTNNKFTLSIVGISEGAQSI